MTPGIYLLGSGIAFGATCRFDTVTEARQAAEHRAQVVRIGRDDQKLARWIKQKDGSLKALKLHPWHIRDRRYGAPPHAGGRGPDGRPRGFAVGQPDAGPNLPEPQTPDVISGIEGELGKTDRNPPTLE
jgi:hypothetical protein